jgi:hypothetical protein
MAAAGTIISVLILRSDPKDRVSKDGPWRHWCVWPSFGTPAFGRLLRMRGRVFRGCLRMRIA